jgi:hypothetical protein
MAYFFALAFFAFFAFFTFLAMVSSSFAGAAALEGRAAPYTRLRSPDSAWFVCKRADVSCWKVRKSDLPTSFMGLGCVKTPEVEA